ncbi:endophilin-A-like [Copidosoma floridanum]|uniref:endophilin-A-like n=1 Tax=Copidosoma floridanum TaxID=29053 RepID=UPI0006C972FF|nr:endophilin-A-like [Copidosoma floridanum]
MSKDDYLKMIKLDSNCLQVYSLLLDCASNVYYQYPCKAPVASSLDRSPLPSPCKSPARTPIQSQQQPYCRALYDFEPENSGELAFKENDSIVLHQKIDDNWFEGSVNGRTGYFPMSYVQVVIPLP